MLKNVSSILALVKKEVIRPLLYGDAEEVVEMVELRCRSKPTGEQCLNNTRSREAHVATDGAP
jgi:hypothetical protein